MKAILFMEHRFEPSNFVKNYLDLKIFFMHFLFLSFDLSCRLLGLLQGFFPPKPPFRRLIESHGSCMCPLKLKKHVVPLAGGLLMRSPSGLTCKVVAVIAHAARQPTQQTVCWLFVFPCFLYLPDNEVSLLCFPPPNLAHYFLFPSKIGTATRCGLIVFQVLIWKRFEKNCFI